jgi:hypothetical protein
MADRHEGEAPKGCPNGLPPPDGCTCAVMLILSATAAGLLALGLRLGDVQEPQTISCAVSAVVVGSCRYECNCRTACGALRTPCGDPSRSDARVRRRVCDSCPGHKYLYVAQTPSCSTQGYGAFSALLHRRATAMQVTGGAVALAGIEPGLINYRQSEDPTSWTCAADPVYSVGDSVASCQMLSCEDGEFGSEMAPYPTEANGSVFLVVGLLLAVLVVVQLACIAKWQVLRVCGRLPPESVVMVVQPAPVAVEEVVKPLGP